MHITTLLSPLTKQFLRAQEKKRAQQQDDDERVEVNGGGRTCENKTGGEESKKWKMIRILGEILDESQESSLWRPPRLLGEIKSFTLKERWRYRFRMSEKAVAVTVRCAIREFH